MVVAGCLRFRAAARRVSRHSSLVTRHCLSHLPQVPSGNRRPPGTGSRQPHFAPLFQALRSHTFHNPERMRHPRFFVRPWDFMFGC